VDGFDVRPAIVDADWPGGGPLDARRAQRSRASTGPCRLRLEDGVDRGRHRNRELWSLTQGSVGPI